MLATTTGNFPIGVRRGWTAWQNNLDAFLTWCQAHDIGVVDVGADIEACRKVSAAGVRVGSADLTDWKHIISADKKVRDDAVAKAAAFVTEAASLGVRHFFCVMLPEKPELKRSENFKYMVEGFAALAPSLEKHQAAVVIEGWPGPGALCCTPEGYRAFFKEVSSSAMAVNYDPSHLLRMGIDPVRFLGEFIGRVKHVHGKDTEIRTENLYELGTELPATFAADPSFGGTTWRYTIPGHGAVRWPRIFQVLRDADYRGAVSIELEDGEFNGTEEGEKRGILAATAFLQTC